MADHGIRGERQGGIVDKYLIGVVIDPLPGDERYRGMLSIPYVTPSGVRAIKFRRLDGGKPKFAAPKNQPVRLFNVMAYFGAGSRIGLAEGEIDPIVATEFLGVPTLGVPGTEMWAKYGPVWTPLFKNFREVLVFKDGDPEQTKTRDGEEVKYRPGDDLANAICESLKSKARVIDCPVPEDVSSMVAAGRGKELADQWAEAKDDDMEVNETDSDIEVDLPPF